MEVGDRKELRLASRTPRGRRRGMALGTAPIPARVIREVLVAAVIAPAHMAPERDRAARREITERAPVTRQDRRAMAGEVRVAVTGCNRSDGGHRRARYNAAISVLTVPCSALVTVGVIWV